jgi:hypothetical protein
MNAISTVVFVERCRELGVYGVVALFFGRFGFGLLVEFVPRVPRADANW